LSELPAEVEEVSGSRVVRFVGELEISTEGPASAEIGARFVDDAREIAAGNGGS
jgi:hypothetical protein